MNTRFFVATVVLSMAFSLPQLTGAQDDFEVEVDLEVEPQENYFRGGNFDDWHLAKQYLTDWRQGSEEHQLKLHSLLERQDFLSEELGVTTEEEEKLQSKVTQEAKRLLDALNVEPKSYARVVELQRFVVAHRLKPDVVGGLSDDKLESKKFALRRELLRDYAKRCCNGEIEKLPILESGMVSDLVISFKDLGISKKEISRLRHLHAIYLAKGYLNRWRQGYEQSLRKLVWHIFEQDKDGRPTFEELEATDREADKIQVLVDKEDRNWFESMSEIGQNEPNAR